MAHINLGDSIPLPTGGPEPVTGIQQLHKAPKGYSTNDSISTAGGHSGSGTAQSYSPELMEALYIMWFNTGGNPVLLQNLSGTSNAVGSVDADAFKAQISNQMQQVCVGMLNTWSDSVKKEIEDDKKEVQSANYKDWQARQGKSGYEDYLKSLTPEQRFRIEEYPKLQTSIRIGEGGVAAIDNYTRAVAGSNDPAVIDNLASLTAAVVIGGGLSYDYAAPGSISSGTLIPIVPVKDANDTLFQKMAPNQSAELGYIGSLFSTAAAYTALGQTIKTANVAEGGSINLAFARNYAVNLSKSINSSEFNSFCLTLIAHSIQGGTPLNREQLDQLVKQTKVVLLATSLALLYKMESSFKGVGGGVTGQEFMDLVGGNIEKVSPLDKLLAEQLNGLVSSLPNGQALLANVAAWVDATNQSNSQLINVEPLIAGMVAGYNYTDQNA